MTKDEEILELPNLPEGVVIREASDYDYAMTLMVQKDFIRSRQKPAPKLNRQQKRSLKP